MRWRKLGCVHCARGERPWRASHAYCPTPIDTGDGRLRVLCAFLDADKVGRVGWVDVDAADPTRVLAVSDRPALDAGKPGAFDEHGVTPLSACRLDDGRVRLYYAGWQRAVGVRYFLFTGLAESDDDGESFRRVSRAPVLDRSDGELCMRTGGHVRRENGRWRMWYAGGSEWVGEKPRYALREVVSGDGVEWATEGRVCLEPRAGELGFGRPYVLDGGDGRLRMWYSLRSLAGYTIGYAESGDGGATWERRDEQAGIEPSAVGWDSEMVGLSCIARGGGETYLFYNGNGYGQTGFGVAVAEGL
jgi:hypothetical protein